MRPASYKRWATCIVFPTGYPSFLEASCCKVDVVNGAAGDFFAGFFCKSAIVKSDVEQVCKKFSAAVLDSKFFGMVALNAFPSELINWATTL